MKWLLESARVGVIVVIAVLTALVARFWLASDPPKSTGATAGAPANRSKAYDQTCRIRGVPIGWNEDTLRSYLQQHVEGSCPVIKSLALEIDGASRTATATLQRKYSGELRLPSDGTAAAKCLTLDTHFHGITTLYYPPAQDHKVEYVNQSRHLLTWANLVKSHRCARPRRPCLRVLQGAP